MIDSKRIPIVLSDFGLTTLPIAASVWFAPVGSRVLEGDRILEVCVGDAIIDLPSPATGKLVHKCVAEDDPLSIGQILGYILPSESCHQKNEWEQLLQ